MAAISMPPVPEAMHRLLAKSEPRESLVQHTWNVLNRLAEQARLRPRLAKQLDEPRLWTLMYWACFLHDFGKAASGFQDVLAGRALHWRNRHEALSLAFIDWLFPVGKAGAAADRVKVIAAIACHHKDADFMVDEYQERTDPFGTFGEPEDDRVTLLLGQIADDDVKLLYCWLADYGNSWAEALGLEGIVEPLRPPPEPEALRMVTPKAVHQALRDMDAFAKKAELSRVPEQFVLGVMLRGLILTADHAGSAESKQDIPPYEPVVLPTVEHIFRPDWERFSHQDRAAKVPRGSALLIAPTSSGKTETAIRWVLRQAELDGHPPTRLFYALPYQASMNAMWDRLRSMFPNGETIVGLQHGRALLALYRDAMEQDADSLKARQHARAQRDLARLNGQPVRIFSPYQMLKAAYRLKGFEALLLDYYDALFIFDEIHAYEPKRLALIVSLVKLLRERFAARFLVMTATLPPTIREVLLDALGEPEVIEADADVFRRFQRHRVHLLEEGILDPTTLTRILTDHAAGRAVLVCCNTVRRAREVFDALHKGLPEFDRSSLMLIHSRFNGRDRLAKETLIRERTGVGVARHGAPLVVATQVVEVSLNIDLDVLYSEPAPLEALLQRFGRINRGHPPGTPLAPVYVSREAGPNDHYIYSHELVNKALDILHGVDGQPVDEGTVGHWLEDIYSGYPAKVWREEFGSSVKAFRESVLRWLKPFYSATGEEAALFGRLFDGAEVLPVDQENEYQDRIAQHDYIGASELLVPVAWRDVERLQRGGLAWREGDEYFYRANVPYTAHFGLDLFSAFEAERVPEAD